MNVKGINVIMAVLLALLGIIITLQLKSMQKENILQRRQKDVKQLNEFLNQEIDKGRALEQVLSEKERELEKIEDSQSIDKNIQDLKSQLDTVRAQAGYTDVSGEGIVITLDDSNKRISSDIDPNETVIHDWQLAEILNILKGAGAQALSINEERLVSTSEIQCAGPTVSVNHIRYAVPFIIKATGDSDKLAAVLETYGGVIDIMKINGIQVNVSPEDKVEIPRFRQITTTSIFNVEAGENK